jgi:hypothetical protein
VPNKKEKIIIKKVKAYPIPAIADIKGIKKPVDILKVAPVGVWANLGTTLVQVGLTYTLDFELPVLKEHITCTAKCLRTMDRVHEAPGGAKTVERLAEFQYLKPPSEMLEKIQKFLAAINSTLD